MQRRSAAATTATVVDIEETNGAIPSPGRDVSSDGGSRHEHKSATVTDPEKGADGNDDINAVPTLPPVVLFGQDLSNYSGTSQFVILTSGVFCFNVMYGYLQELLSVHVAGRKFALFLAVCQFAGYAFWSYVLDKMNRMSNSGNNKDSFERSTPSSPLKPDNSDSKPTSPPYSRFIGLSVVRAFDLAVTNSAMYYLNYPAKTLIKSCRVVFTMFLGILIQGKRYKIRDYCAVFTLVIGLGIFLHADSTTSAVFHPLGVLLLSLSLICDGSLNNWSEQMMDQHSMSQDEFHAKLYLVSFVATVFAAHANGELSEGVEYFLLQPGTIPEIDDGRDPTWTVHQKVMALVLFGTTGIMGASCLGAITRRFGALTMALTSTARKATTLFLSFGAFQNHFTLEHGVGVTLFMSALIVKALGKAGGDGAIKRQLEHQTAGARPEEQPQNKSDSSSASSGSNNKDYGDKKSGLVNVRWMAPRSRQQKFTFRESIDMELGVPTD